MKYLILILTLCMACGQNYQRHDEEKPLPEKVSEITDTPAPAPLYQGHRLIVIPTTSEKDSPPIESWSNIVEEIKEQISRTGYYKVLHDKVLESRLAEELMSSSPERSSNSFRQSLNANLAIYLSLQKKIASSKEFETCSGENAAKIILQTKLVDLITGGTLGKSCSEVMISEKQADVMLNQNSSLAKEAANQLLRQLSRIPAPPKAL